MNKILMIFLMIVPITAFAEIDLGMQSQMLDSQIEKLTSERDSKYEALQKCEKKTKGFKIAGLTTLVATGFGIYGNIKLSEKIKGKGSRHGGNGVLKDLSVVEHVRALCKTQKNAGVPEWQAEDCDAIKDDEETRNFWEQYTKQNGT